MATKFETPSYVCQKIITWAPWRTLISVPLLSIDMNAASSTSASVDKSSFRGFEKMAFNSYSYKTIASKTREAPQQKKLLTLQKSKIISIHVTKY